MLANFESGIYTRYVYSEINSTKVLYSYGRVGTEQTEKKCACPFYDIIVQWCVTSHRNAVDCCTLAPKSLKQICMNGIAQQKRSMLIYFYSSVSQFAFGINIWSERRWLRFLWLNFRFSTELQKLYRGFAFSFACAYSLLFALNHWIFGFVCVRGFVIVYIDVDCLFSCCCSIGAGNSVSHMQRQRQNTLVHLFNTWFYWANNAVESNVISLCLGVTSLKIHVFKM